MGSRWIHSIHTTNHAPDKPNNIKWQTLFQKVADTFSWVANTFSYTGPYRPSLPYFGHRKAIMAKVWQN
jgi:hypothetical protein